MTVADSVAPDQLMPQAQSKLRATLSADKSVWPYPTDKQMVKLYDETVLLYAG